MRAPHAAEGRRSGWLRSQGRSAGDFSIPRLPDGKIN